MLGLKFQLSDALKISDNTVFAFNTRTHLCHRQRCSVWGTDCSAGWYQGWSQGTQLLPCWQPGGTTAPPGSTPPPHTMTTCYWQGGGNRTHWKRHSSWKKDKREDQDVRRERRQHQAPFPSKDLPLSPHCLQPTLLQSHNPCHRHYPPFSCEYPSPPWQYASIVPSMVLSSPLSFWKPQTGERSARQNLKPVQVWNTW